MLLVGGGDGRKPQDGSSPSLISRRVKMPESSITLVRVSSGFVLVFRNRSHQHNIG